QAAATKLRTAASTRVEQAASASAFHLRFDRLSCSMRRRRSFGSDMASLRAFQGSSERAAQDSSLLSLQAKRSARSKRNPRFPNWLPSTHKALHVQRNGSKPSKKHGKSCKLWKTVSAEWHFANCCIVMS